MGKIKKTELIAEIIDLYDRVERCDRELEAEHSDINYWQAEEMRREATIIRVGRKEVFDKAYAEWSAYVKVSQEDGSKRRKPETYKEWAKKVVITSNLPEEFSLNDFLVYFNVELRTRYEEEVSKALAKAQEETESEE